MKPLTGKILRISSIIAVISLILITLSVSLILYFYPEKAVLDLIRKRAEALTERKITIGSLHYGLKGVILYNVSLTEKSPSGGESMLLKADELVITFQPLSIIKKKFRISTLYFHGLEINCIYERPAGYNLSGLIETLNKKNSDSEQKIDISKIILTECRFRFINPPPLTKPLEGEYTLNATIKNRNGHLSVSNSRVILTSGRGTIYSEFDLEVSDHVKVAGRLKLENTSLPWVYKFSESGLILPYEIVNVQINKFEIFDKRISGHVTGTSTLKNSKSRVQVDGDCIVDIYNHLVDISNVKCKLNTSSTYINTLQISTSAGVVKKIGLTDASFHLGDLRLLVNQIPQGLSGLLKGYVLMDNGFSTGKIEIINGGYKNEFEIMAGMNTTVDVNRNSIRKENIPVRLFGNECTVSVATTDNKFSSFYIYLQSSRMKIGRETIFISNKAGLPSIPAHISIKATIGELLYDDYLFKNIRADIYASDYNIKVNRIDTLIYNGSITSSGNINISGEFPAVQAVVKFGNVKIQDIKFKDQNLNGRLFGFADGHTNLQLTLNKNASETLKGNLTFSITKGKVVNTGIQNGLIFFLSELRYKLTDLEFNKIYGNMDINGKNFHVNSFIFNSEDLRMSVNGNFDSDLQAREMLMKLEFNNHFIKDVPRPAMAMFNPYSSGKWFVIPFRLNGIITDSKNIKMIKKNQ